MNDTISVSKLKGLLERRAARDKEFEPLMAKYTDAKARGLELKDADRKRLLALLLDAVLDGTVGYTSTYRT
jgi:hypothetical protein